MIICLANMPTLQTWLEYLHVFQTSPGAEVQPTANNQQPSQTKRKEYKEKKPPTRIIPPADEDKEDRAVAKTKDVMLVAGESLKGRWYKRLVSRMHT